MHEMSLVAALLDLVDAAAERDPFQHVREVGLTLGTLSCVDADTLRWCIEQASPGTRLEGARVTLSTAPPEATCNACQQPFAPASWPAPCPTCNTLDTTLIHGQDMVLDTLLVE